MTYEAKDSDPAVSKVHAVTFLTTVILPNRTLVWSVVPGCSQPTQKICITILSGT